MYSLGLWYRLVAVGLFMVFLGLLIMLISKIAKEGRYKKKGGILAVFLIMIGIIYSTYYYVTIKNPSPETKTIIFVEEYRDSRVAPPFPFTMAYVFFDGTNKITVYLDVISQKTIYPEEFVAGTTYEIIFERNTNVIMKVTKIPGQ
ncbi:MAG: hypothetical protein II038_07280 [Lachnospiraceae bacterium]|nr:hypothetical protein [Lachnospiraceae bacterium]